MPRIVDYGTLKEEIRLYLWQRKDLNEMIPGFIDLAERKMFRNLRVPNMEVLLKYEPLDLLDEDTEEGELIGYTQLELPGDSVEIKFLLAGDRPLERISDIQIQQRLHRMPARGLVRKFARIGNRLFLWPVSDDRELLFTLSYWTDFSGTLTTDTATHEMLRTAPDLYLYGALLEAAPYLVTDSRVETWQTLFDISFGQLEMQYKEAEYAGSNVSVSNAGQGVESDYAFNSRRLG